MQTTLSYDSDTPVTKPFSFRLFQRGSPFRSSREGEAAAAAAAAEEAVVVVATPVAVVATVATSVAVVASSSSEALSVVPPSVAAAEEDEKRVEVKAATKLVTLRRRNSNLTFAPFEAIVSYRTEASPGFEASERAVGTTATEEMTLLLFAAFPQAVADPKFLS